MEIKKLGMIGAGNMGGMMALLFAEHDIEIHIFDPSDDAVDQILAQAKKAGLADKIFHQRDYASLCRALSSPPKVFVLSVPHGSVGDKTIDGLEPHLAAGDVIMDASNERWTRTERRQARLAPLGVHWVGMGVSGGYQAARRGPSISPGAGSTEALDLVWPFLRLVAARDARGRPCVARLSNAAAGGGGGGGCGHYVKMVHNGIEHGMLTVLCEVWGLMTRGGGPGGHRWAPEEIADAFARWNEEADSPLRDNFLLEIGAEICRKKDPEGKGYVLDSIRDKVVQDVCEEEGTGTWTVEEAARLHVSAPTIAAAHFARVQSAYASRREANARSFRSHAGAAGVLAPETSQDHGTEEARRTAEGKGRAEAERALRDATYAGFLTCFVQGMHVLEAANREHGWALAYGCVLQLWRGGCIIRSGAIVDLLDGVYADADAGGARAADRDNLLAHPAVARELAGAAGGLKEVVARALGADAFAPALGASLEYLKYSASTDLPTSFQEAELDFFGHHNYDLKSEGPGEPVMGKHHFEWRPARGIREEKEAA